MPLTVPEIVDIAKVSGYLTADDVSLGNAFGARKDGDISTKIFLVRKAVEWELLYEKLADEVKAVGKVTITDGGNNGDSIQIWVNDPILGVLELVEYIGNGMDNPTQTAQAIVNTANTYWQLYGYVLTAVGADVFITARQGIGALINVGINLFIIIINNTNSYPFIFDNTFDNNFN